LQVGEVFIWQVRYIAGIPDPSGSESRPIRRFHLASTYHEGEKMGKGRVKLVLFASMLCLVVGIVAKLKADETSVETKRAQLVTAAKEAYKATDAAFRLNRCVVDEVYMWSRRLMQSEQLQGTNANAASEHTSRMHELHDYVLDLREKNPQRSLEHICLQTTYYLLEAEIGQATN
jgi:hypothetical protein